MKENFFVRQSFSHDCGDACFKMILNFFQIPYDEDAIQLKQSKQGTTFSDLIHAFKKFDINANPVKVDLPTLKRKDYLPCIVHLTKNHFVIILEINNKTVKIADPSNEIRNVPIKKFSLEFFKEDEVGFALIFSNLYHQKIKDQISTKGRKNFNLIIKEVLLTEYISFALILVSLFTVALIQFQLPYLTKTLIDKAILKKSVNVIGLLLLFQLLFILFRYVIEFIRTRIILFTSTRINLIFLSNFWNKLLNLPLSFFDMRNMGDIFQRLTDHDRVNGFLSITITSTLYSLVTVTIYSIVLAKFDLRLFLIYITSSIIYICWMTLFTSKRKKIDKENFKIVSDENNLKMQMLYGIADIKHFKRSDSYRWKIEDFIISKSRLSLKSMAIDSYQKIGSLFINESSGLIVVFVVILGIIDKKFTIGDLIAIQFIISQLSSPLSQFVQFVQSKQDVGFSLNRINDIYLLKSEDEKKHSDTIAKDFDKIVFENLSFSYVGQRKVLDNLNLVIPRNKVTAIIGASGSGKTTIFKLLLKYYDNYEGKIHIGSSFLQNISHESIRNTFSAVLQDGFIFDDNILNNIIMDDDVDLKRLENVIDIANIKILIDSLPNKMETKIGIDGWGLSQGEKQRLLIARALYKKSDVILMDEATNALDTVNERLISQRILKEYDSNKTLIIIAHRLSTIIDADNIVLIKNGKVASEGNHQFLLINSEEYRTFINNQIA